MASIGIWPMFFVCFTVFCLWIASWAFYFRKRYTTCTCSLCTAAAEGPIGGLLTSVSGRKQLSSRSVLSALFSLAHSLLPLCLHCVDVCSDSNGFNYPNRNLRRRFRSTFVGPRGARHEGRLLSSFDPVLVPICRLSRSTQAGCISRRCHTIVLVIIY